MGHFLLDEWRLSGKNNKLKIRENSKDSVIELSIEEPGPVYLLYRREHSNFRKVERVPPIDIRPGSWVSVTADIDGPSGANARLGISTYVKRRPFSVDQIKYWGTKSAVSAKLEDNTVSAAIYVRFDKRGTYLLKSFDVKTHRYRIDSGQSSSAKVKIPDGANRLRIKFDAVSYPEGPSSALATVEWRDGQGQIVSGLADHAINPSIGPYEYINKNGLNNLSFDIPKYASEANIKLLPWKSGASIFITEELDIEFDKSQTKEIISDTDQIRSTLSGIPYDEGLIVLHTTAPPLGHSTLSLRPNRLAREFERLGYNVIFLPFSVVKEGVNRHSSKSWVICRSLWPILQLELSRRNGRHNFFICTSFPNFEAMSAMDLLGLSGWTTAYEIRDDMEEFNRVGYSKWFDVQLERYVTRRANKVLAVSPRLAQKANLIGNRSDAIVSPNAVSDFLFDAGRNYRSLEHQAAKAGRRIVGYLGHLTDSWFDWRLVLNVAHELSDYEFRIVGHGIPERVENSLPSNVHFLGPMTHEQFVNEAAAWNVGLIPFKMSPLTFGVDPNKLYEYLALGVPVVSAPMGSVDSAPFTRVYRTQTELREAIVDLVSLRFSSEGMDELEEYLHRSRWDFRAQRVIDILEEGIK